MSQYETDRAAGHSPGKPRRLKTAQAILLISLLFLGTVAAVLTFAHAFLPGGVINRTVSTLPLFAHTFAFPLQCGAALLVLSALVLIVILVRRRIRRALRPVWIAVPALAALCGVFLVLSATNIALPTTLDKELNSNSPDLVVVSWNGQGYLDRESARIIFGDLDADIAILPEVGDFNGDTPDLSFLQEELAAGGADPTAYDVFESPPTGTQISPVTVIIRKGFGSYRSVEIAQTTFGTLHLMPPEGSGLPEVIAVHTAPPLPGLMTDWRSDLKLVKDLAHPLGANALIAGDFNATMRHGDLSAITSHADAVGSIPGVTRGTWPLSAPQFLRSSIDHVLVPRETYAVHESRIVDISGSDHAAVVTKLSARR